MSKNRRVTVTAITVMCAFVVALISGGGMAQADESTSDAFSNQSISDTIVTTPVLPDPLTVQGTSDYDIGSGSITCDKTGTLYRITGSSNSNTIKVKGGSASNPILVDLAGVSMFFSADDDGDSTEASPLTIEDDAYAIIYIGKDDAGVVDELHGGNEHGVGKNTGYAGICVKNKAHVLISGQGTLNVSGGGVQYGAAAIGGNYNDDVSDLTIDGTMTINATGGYSAPGIGSGRDGELYNLVINNGNIHATGGRYAPGIGAGDAVGTGGGGTMHSLTINGGTITAIGGEKAAGIGGSEGGSTGDIYIRGGVIDAMGGSEGAGIGGGSGGAVTSIGISGGVITATGGDNAAGIGGGKDANSGVISLEQDSDTFDIAATGGINGAGIGSAKHDSNEIHIIVNGGSIHAFGGDSAAGIGAGAGDAGKILIQGSGLVAAKGGKQGCGIGAGEDSTADEITIEGTITQNYGRPLTIDAEALTVVPTDETSLKWGPAFYSNKNAAIGSGRSECGPITITNAIVNAAANGYGADIGGGNNHGWNPASVASIFISNCAVTSVDFAGNVPGDKVAPSIGAGASGNVGTIEIYNSTVTGAGIGAASENFDDCNAVDSIIIQGCTVSAIRQDVDWDASNSRSQAAGIGSGIKGDVGSIDIEDSTVTAQGVGGGAGIGSGGVSGESYSEDANPGTSDVGTITIKRSNITATGSVQGVTSDLKSGGAGIGLGFAVKGSGTIHSILIDQCSNVTATGEWGAAGIGTSCGSNFTGGDDGDGNVTIMYSNVTATGGYGAAGIGAGMQYKLHGGDARIIKITGASGITAAGGEGAAGIGGGLDGGVDDVTIALESTGLPPASQEYVTATGGLGAAGIGSGAGGHDVGSVTIQSGYVTATGGADLNGGGSGAGIGGGNGAGTLKSLVISGGVTTATAGGADAFDIGRGGTGSSSSSNKDGSFTITGGTVWSNTISTTAYKIFTGGSISANLPDAGNDSLAVAHDASGTAVYRTTLTLPIGGYTKVDVSSFVNGYGTNDIYSDGSRKVYLYRTATDAFKASAVVTTAYEGSPYHYIGQTLADGSGLLKIQPQLSFKDPETAPVVGDTFQIDVDDSELTNRWGDCVYTVSGCVSETNNPPSNARHKGAYVSLTANSIGAYTVTATCAAPPESADVYWPVTATYTGTISKQAGTISITEDPSKVYDGQNVTDPSVDKVGDGAITYTYYTGTDVTAPGAQLTAAPVDQGTYTVVANMAESAHYGAATASQTFTIAPRPITLGITAAVSGSSATLTAMVTNAVDVQGAVSFNVTLPDGTTKTVSGDVSQDTATGMYIATANFDGVGAGTYTVEASYVPSMSNDYSCAATATATFDKSYVERSISVSQPDAVSYGSATFNLNASASTSLGASDVMAYEVVGDEFAAYGLAPTILVDNSGYVTPVNAGIAYVKITLTDQNKIYAPATAYVKVTVKRAKLAVTSYAADSAGNELSGATYGGLDGITYGLKYGNADGTEGFVNGETADTFTGGHGVLAATPLAVTSPVGSYTIGITRTGDGSVTINGITYYNVFVSRNYEIVENDGSLDVAQAALAVTANDATGTWHGTEPAYTVSVDGLAPWDTLESVFSEQPTASLDLGTTGGKAFSELEPGTYEDAIAVSSAGTQIANSDGGENYQVVTFAGALSVSKADSQLSLSVDSKTYDGNPVQATVSTSTDPLFDGTTTVTYYPFGSQTPLTGAPADAGQYRAVATVRDAAHFSDDTAMCLFTINKATPTPDIPTLPNIVYHDGLTLAEQSLPEGWTWDAPGTSLDAGTVSANATYTPSDTTNYNTVTRALSFEVTPIDGSITITTDPSKTYDGTPVSDPEVSTVSQGEVTYTYYTGADTSASPLESAPVNAGDYTVVATVASDGNYNEASASRQFSIAKATPVVDTPSLAAIIYRDGLTLADQALPEGWTWNDPTCALSVGPVSADATYTPADTANYTTVPATLSFDVQMAQGTVAITEDLSKTYNGLAVADPTVSTVGDGTVSFAYYVGTDTSGSLLGSAPVDAGTYTVVATLAETANYAGAVDSETFTISPASVIPGISAVREGDGTITVTVTAMGLATAEGTTTITLTDPTPADPASPPAPVTTTVGFSETSAGSGVFTATASFDPTPSGTCAFEATYDPDESGNYSCDSTASITLDAGKATRSIDVAESFDKTYGDASFNLNASTTSPLDSDVYSYAMVEDPLAARGFDASASVDGSGNVSILNAGSCTIEVTLTDSTGAYDDATAYVKVVIARAPLTVTSYAALDGALVTEATYGSLGNLTYELGFDGLLNGDQSGDFTNGHGTLQARALDEHSIVSDTPYPIFIDQVGADGIAPAAEGGSLFISRNYAITYQLGSLKVNPAALTVSAADATGTWGGSEPTYGTNLEGAASWDNAGTIFSVSPTVALDTSKTSGQTFGQLEPGTYTDVLGVTDSGTIKPNANGLDNYVVTIADAGGDLTVQKAQGTISITGDPSKAYDGSPVTDPAVSANGSGSVTYLYYAGTDTSATPLASAPSAAGDYTVVAVMAEDGHYTSASTSRAFTISGGGSGGGSGTDGGPDADGGTVGGGAAGSPSTFPKTGDILLPATMLLVMLMLVGGTCFAVLLTRRSRDR